MHSTTEAEVLSIIAIFFLSARGNWRHRLSLSIKKKKKCPLLFSQVLHCCLVQDKIVPRSLLYNSCKIASYFLYPHLMLPRGQVSILKLLEVRVVDLTRFFKQQYVH